jgi:hypothetical protein
LNEIYQSAGVVFRTAKPSDDALLKTTLRENAMDSWVRLSFAREPSYFDGESLIGKSYAVLAYEENQPDLTVGMYSAAFLPVHLNGVAEQIGYLGGLRVNQHYRHKIHILKGGFASIPHLIPQQNTVPFWFTSVASENTPARRLLESGLKGMPSYRPVGEMETLAMNTRQGKLQGLLQQATPQDIPALVAFFNRHAAQYQFSPDLTPEWLQGLSGDKGLHLSDFWLAKNGEDIQACLAIWDQRAFKQTVCCGYRSPLNACRNIYNLFALATGRVQLPKAGGKLQQVFLSFIAMAQPEPTSAVQIVREGLAHAREKGADVGVIGLSVANPLLATLKKSLKPSIYRTCIETVSLSTDSVPNLNGLPPQPEVALL